MFREILEMQLAELKKLLFTLCALGIMCYLNFSLASRSLELSETIIEVSEQLDKYVETLEGQWLSQISTSYDEFLDDFGMWMDYSYENQWPTVCSNP